MLGELYFEKFEEIKEEVVLVDVAIGQNCDIKIGILTGKSTDQRAELGNPDF
jgi:hypothetical protein